jgi:hypothetical protein
MTIVGVWIGFIASLYTRLVTTSNYSPNANLHNLQNTTAPAKPFFRPAVSPSAVPWQRLLTMEILQLPALTSFLHRRPFRTVYLQTADLLALFPRSRIFIP